MDMEGNVNVTDEMIEAALITWFKNEASWDKGMAPWSADQFRVEMRATLESALSASPAGVVKPLEWKEGSPGTHMLVAASAFGVYCAWEINGKGVWSIGASPGKLAGGGIEAAKSAAFADYSARIMSAIEPAGVGVETSPPQTHVEGWQWRSRMKGGAWDAWENGQFGHEVPPFMEVEERKTPIMEVIWIQNLKGFIEGKFPADERWKKIFIEHLNRVNEEEQTKRKQSPSPAPRASALAALKGDEQ